MDSFESFQHFWVDQGKHHIVCCKRLRHIPFFLMEPSKIEVGEGMRRYQSNSLLMLAWVTTLRGTAEERVNKHGTETEIPADTVPLLVLVQMVQDQHFPLRP